MPILDSRLSGRGCGISVITKGRNILIEYRPAGGKPERSSSRVAELMQLKVDVLVSGDLVTIQAAKEATKAIPIVMVTTEDPIEAGLVDSLARPGGNVTGSLDSPEN
jgi:putative tryptophan/tyrosine transport system substrate-binding protein